MIAVVSYGVCNVGSILNMLRKIGVPAHSASTGAEIARAEKLILPGIGAFDSGMRALTGLGLVGPLLQRAREDRVPTLGICLGLQLLGQGSEEGGMAGLGLLGGRSVRFRSTPETPLRVPHMGWNALSVRRADRLLDGLEQSRFYFTHSYHFVCDEPADVLATVAYGDEVTAVVRRDFVWGVQFHPEKSHRFGMTLLRNFAQI